MQLMGEPRSIGEHIDCLARLTGAPLVFIDQVRSLFASKGISLESEAQPFVQALEQAFRREENIRASSHAANHHLSRIRENFRKVGKAYVEQLSQFRRMQSSLQKQSRKLRGKPTKNSSLARTRVTISGDHRTFVTRPVREQLPMVPGPKEMQ